MNTKLKAAFKWIVPTALLIGFAFQPVSADHKHYKKHRYYSDGYPQHNVYRNHRYKHGYKHRLKQKRYYRNNHYKNGHYYYKPHHYGYKRKFRDGRRFKRHSNYQHRNYYYNGSGFYVYFD